MSLSSSVFPPPAFSRTVTIVAHVDHGKTSLADNLLQHNGIISERLAGTLRFLDSDSEEQRRGITMRTSAVGIRHEKQQNVHNNNKNNNKQDQNNTSTKNTFIVHLVDSPGHADFRNEVTTSLVACDAALIVLDVVEGMGARTLQVLRETHAHALVPILVLNKLDRLATELRLTPNEAYLRLRNLLETVNAAAAAMLTATTTTENTTGTTDGDEKANDSNALSKEQHEHQQKLWTFDPAVNVVFASALYGLGFTVTSLARSLYQSHQVPIKPGMLKQYLFGDYKYRSSDNKVLKWKQQDDSNQNMCMFAEFALEPLWQIYQGVTMAAASSSSLSSAMTVVDTSIKATTPGMDQVLLALQVAPPIIVSDAATNTTTKRIESAQDLQAILTQTGSSSEQAVLRCVLRRYRNLSVTLLDLICDYCPSPAIAVKDDGVNSVRSQVLQLQTPPIAASLQKEGEGEVGETSEENDDVLADFATVQRAVSNCDPSGPCVAHVCKFMSTDASHIRDAQMHQQQQLLQQQHRRHDKRDGHNNVILGLARVLSGTLKTDKAYYCLGPKHEYNAAAAKATVRLYVVMGSDFVLVDAVPAGHLCAVYNLQDLQLKTVTLCDSPHGMPLQGFGSLLSRVRPLLKVNVEPEDAADAEELEQGLVKLSLADAAVEVTATAKGERILACLGELHLEQSIHDLKNVYCGKDLKLRISDPIVDFGETTDWFDNETDFTSFVTENANNNSTSPFLLLLPQMTIPPYCEEEGLSFAKQGRMRSVLTGKVAAIQLRVVPLADSLYKAMKQRRVEKGCEEELIKMGRVLKIGNTIDENYGCSSTSNAEAMLNALCDCLCSLGSNGNALVETPALRHGVCVRGVEAKEVYVVPARSENKKEEASNNGNIEDDGGCASAVASGNDVYKDLENRISRTGFQDTSLEKQQQQTTADEAAFEIWKNEMKGSAILGGFQMALRAGPICEEPIRNVLVVLESVEIAVQRIGEEQHWQSAKPLSGGMVVSALRIGIRCALLSRPVRLMEGMLRLTLHSSLHDLGALYSVLSKRRGRVLEETMVDDGSTDLLSITALIPQAEVFGLTSELLSKTRGHVTAPEMIFGHWERLEVDPFWVPTSQEEREDFGNVLMGDTSTGVDNPALRYIRQVRQRKGWKVDSTRTVVAAEKQRTLKR